MAMQRVIVDIHAIPNETLERWRQIPSTIASDTQNRGQSMDARIKPVTPGMTLCGQARTVVCMPGDNSMLLAACSLAAAGEVVVVSGAGLEDVAMAGEWVARSCKARGLGGLVVDGSVRDIAVLRELGFPVFAKGWVPRGPHKGFGGKMDVIASVGGVAVHPGDLIIGDDDGVVVVPQPDAEEVLKLCEDLKHKEDIWSRELEAGRTLMEVLGVPAPLESPKRVIHHDASKRIAVLDPAKIVLREPAKRTRRLPDMPEALAS